MIRDKIKEKVKSLGNNLNNKLDSLYKLIATNERDNCKSCERNFTWHTWENKCEYCGSSFCIKCISCFTEEFNENFNVNICDLCWNTYTTGINSMIVVKSPQIGRYKVVRHIDKIYTSEWNDFNDVESEIKHLGFINGANAILEFRYKKRKESKVNENGNTYYYSKFIGSGKAVVIEPFDGYYSHNIKRFSDKMAHSVN